VRASPKEVEGMSEKTNIEWATQTGNPWIGCTKVSPGWLEKGMKKYYFNGRWLAWDKIIAIYESVEKSYQFANDYVKRKRKRKSETLHLKEGRRET
jgi:hypothetical protein